MLEIALQRLDTGARLALPFITVIIGVFLGVVAIPLPYFGMVAPPLGLMTLYYWAIHRPDLFRPSMAFAVGLLYDIINGLPLGLSALLFVAAHQLVLQQRRFFSGHSFFMTWAGFILMILIVMIAEWIGISMLKQATPVGPILAQTILAIVIFPLPCWLLIFLQRKVLPQG